MFEVANSERGLSCSEECNTIKDRAECWCKNFKSKFFVQIDMLHIITERKTFILDMNILDRNTGKMVLLSAVLLLFLQKKNDIFSNKTTSDWLCIASCTRTRIQVFIAFRAVWFNFISLAFASLYWL